MPAKTAPAAGVAMAAVFVAVSCHVIWWGSVRVPPSANVWGQRVSPRLVMRQAEDAEGNSQQALWSPVLFALPTPVGFSRPLLESNSNLGPPQFSREPPAMLLQRSTEEANPVIGTVDAPLEQLQALSDPVIRSLYRNEARPASQWRWQIDWQGDMPVVENTVLPDARDGVFQQQEILAEIAWGRQGEVVRVLVLENGQRSPRTTEWSRWLYRWRFAPGAEGAARVYVRHLPDNGEAT